MSAVLEVRRTVHELPCGRMELLIEHSSVPLEELFVMGARDNPRRAFLFISKILGKHLPVRPHTLQRSHAMLAATIPAVPQPVLFIGMAETATGLGQGVFEAWLAAHPEARAVFMHTSRYREVGAGQVLFEEAHSHAPNVFLNMRRDPGRQRQFAQFRSVVLVDDEISTGKTLTQLALVVQGHAPELERVHLCTLTDFMGQEASEEAQRKIGIPLTIGALLRGGWRYDPHPSALPTPAAPNAEASGRLVPPTGYGRTGVGKPVQLNPREILTLAATLAAGQRVLVLGTGEFMHPPARLAAALEQASGATCWSQATTRSPIKVWGPISTAHRFDDTYGEGIANYLYNTDTRPYDHVLLCHETEPNAALDDLSRQLGARRIRFHPENRFEDLGICRS